MGISLHYAERARQIMVSTNMLGPNPDAPRCRGPSDGARKRNPSAGPDLLAGVGLFLRKRCLIKSDLVR